MGQITSATQKFTNISGKGLILQYKKGEKVRVKRFKKRPDRWNSDGEMDYLMGKIVEVSTASDKFVYVERQSGYGRWCLKIEDVEPVKNECIVMYRKDNQVIALDKTIGKKAIAKCSPEDEFDFYAGCRIGFDRLTGKEKPKMEPLNAKICVLDDRDKNFTKGKIYNIDNGKITDDKGNVWPGFWRFKNMDEVCDYFSAWENFRHTTITHYSSQELKFIEVVE